MLIDPTHTFLAGIGIILGKDIDVQHRQLLFRRVSGNGYPKTFEHGPGCLDDGRDKIASRLIQPLAHPFRRGDAVYAQRLAKRGVLPHAGYGLKITLAHAEQPKIAPQDIDLGDVIAPGHILPTLRPNSLCRLMQAPTRGSPEWLYRACCRFAPE